MIMIHFKILEELTYSMITGNGYRFLIPSPSPCFCVRGAIIVAISSWERFIY